MNPQDQRFPPPSKAPDSRKLDSWKEIAGYLKRDIRTVQLWEKREGLPIHRHNHSVRASVYGYTNEIDEWQKRRRGNGRATLRDPVREAVAEGGAAEPQREKAEPASGRAEAAPKIERKRGWYVAGGIAAAALLAVAGWLIEKQPRAWGGGSGRGETLAVLPFEDISAVPSEAYVADGLTDDLVTELGRSGRLQVISRTSVMRFKGEREPLPSIAETLKADLVLEGTVLYAGKEARITAKLVDARSDQQIWANSYEQGVDGPEAMIALQDKIAEDITAGVLAKLAGGE